MKHTDLVVHSDVIQENWLSDNSPPDITTPGIYRCHWPDHIQNARYNSDCDIIGPFDSVKEALEYRDRPCDIHPDLS